MAYVIEPTADQAWRLAGHHIHALAHQHGTEWIALDQQAAQCRTRLQDLALQHGDDVTITLWLDLSDTEVACEDPSCQARTTYLRQHGCHTSGPLPGFARTEGLAYYSFTAHPHGRAWATSVDPCASVWMFTALAPYGGFMHVNWMDLHSHPDSVNFGDVLWEISDRQETELQRLVMISGSDGVTTTKSGDPDAPTPPLPPEIAAEQARRTAERKARTAPGAQPAS
jgi:hypothetical protein